MKRFKTDYPGVFYREAKRIGGRGTEKVFYIVFKKDKKVLEEKAGRQYADDMTAARTARIRADRIEGRRMSRQEIREKEKALDKKWSLSRLWDEYSKQKEKNTCLRIDELRFNKHLKPKYGDKAPSELHQLDVDRLRIGLLKVIAPQTVKHVLGLLKRLCNFGLKKQLCPGINFKIEMPRVDNQRTEDLSPVQLQRLLAAMDESPDIEAVAFMKMALFTGMRRGELMKLKWEDIDFERGFISIRFPKSGVSQKIPLNPQARDILINHPKKPDYVFTRANGEPFTNVINRRVRAIREAADLPKDFRPLHGIRHFFASILVSSGMDLYTVGKLLTHKDSRMTARYSHLADATLKRAANVAGDLIAQAAVEGAGAKIIKMERPTEENRG
jgi:integrase